MWGEKKENESCQQNKMATKKKLKFSEIQKAKLNSELHILTLAGLCWHVHIATLPSQHRTDPTREDQTVWMADHPITRKERKQKKQREQRKQRKQSNLGQTN